MKRLGWTPLDLYLATLQYGDVGSLEDVSAHLASGDHLPSGKKAIVAAALWEAELSEDADGPDQPSVTP